MPDEAKTNDPRKEQKVPKKEIPPDLPAEIFQKDVIKTGSDLDKIPISVPQVSAVTAAKVVRYSKYQTKEGKKKWRRTIKAGMLPLARTCQISLVPVFSKESLHFNLVFLPKLERKLEEKKKSRMGKTHSIPPKPNMIAPMKKLPKAPDCERNLNL
jgi:hypothetical protein